MSQLPDGLESYEFQKQLSKSSDTDSLWHLINILKEGTLLPLLTEDGKPDKKDFSWAEMFSKEQIVELEFGSGKGGFLVDYATKHPEINVLGSEWDPKWAHYGARRINRNNLENAKLLRGDIFYFVRDYIPDSSLNAAHMYFPDPWPKKKHHKNRLLRPDFLVELQRVLKPDSFFYWGTDHQEYNELSVELFENTEFIDVVEKNTASPTDGIMTNFEAKYIEEGRPIYRSVLQFRK